LKNLPVPESKLDKRLQNLIQLICNIRAMEEALLEMKFDARKNPLGKLSSTQIKAGYSALKEIETFIKINKFNSAFIEANNTYYTRSIYSSSFPNQSFSYLVPHEFGRSTPPLIKTIQQLKQEIELLEALDDIEIAFTTLNIDTNTRLNPIDQQYEQLKCKLNPVDKTEDTYLLINKYLQSTHATTHQQYKMQIEDVFEVERENEKELFNDVGNKMLLW
jgi:poly [ADP-ribose] polymerase